MLIFWDQNTSTSVSVHCTEVRFANFFSGVFITVIVVNPLEKKLAKRTCVQCVNIQALIFLTYHVQKSWKSLTQTV